MSERGNGGMLRVNVLIGAMLGVNVGMGECYEWNVRSECGNRGILEMNALIGAI